MTEEECEKFIKDKLAEAIKNKDGYSAHFYGRILLPSFVTSPRPCNCRINQIFKV